jgi:hypothetical protein
MDSAQDTLAGGLPHSEIPGSPIARISPGLFAACHVLHRLSVPRHPPDALVSRLIIAPPSPAMHTTAAHRAKPPRAKPQGPTQCLPRTERGAAVSHEDTSLGHIPEQALLAHPNRQSSAAPTGQETLLPGPVRLGHITTLSSPFNQPRRNRPRRCRNLLRASGAPCAASRFGSSAGRTSRGGSFAGLVEVNGFEPMTSCLQSRRSPS